MNKIIKSILLISAISILAITHLHASLSGIRLKASTLTTQIRNSADIKEKELLLQKAQNLKNKAYGLTARTEEAQIWNDLLALETQFRSFQNGQSPQTPPPADKPQDPGQPDAAHNQQAQAQRIIDEQKSKLQKLVLEIKTAVSQASNAGDNETVSKLNALASEISSFLKSLSPTVTQTTVDQLTGKFSAVSERLAEINNQHQQFNNEQQLKADKEVTTLKESSLKLAEQANQVAAAAHEAQYAVGFSSIASAAQTLHDHLTVDNLTAGRTELKKLNDKFEKLRIATPIKIAFADIKASATVEAEKIKNSKLPEQYTQLSRIAEDATQVISTINESTPDAELNKFKTQAQQLKKQLEDIIVEIQKLSPKEATNTDGTLHTKGVEASEEVQGGIPAVTNPGDDPESKLAAQMDALIIKHQLTNANTDTKLIVNDSIKDLLTQILKKRGLDKTIRAQIPSSTALQKSIYTRHACIANTTCYYFEYIDSEFVLIRRTTMDNKKNIVESYINDEYIAKM